MIFLYFSNCRQILVNKAVTAISPSQVQKKENKMFELYKRQKLPCLKSETNTEVPLYIRVKKEDKERNALQCDWQVISIWEKYIKSSQN